ncbi:NUDIX hydrolase [Candidatus Poribacteria bacterium]|nr:NUDIX hydrolase [Candidatus Poribacteria bacterium]
MNHPKHIVAVSGLISHPDGNILLIKSPRRGWEFPGGQVEEGETIIDALIREIEEETGINAAIGSLVGIYSNIISPTKVMFGFLGDYISGELQTSEESLETIWISHQTALQQISNPAVSDRMKDMVNFTGRIIYRAYTTNPYQIYKQCYL